MWMIVYKNGMTNINDMLGTFNKITPTMTYYGSSSK